MSGDVRKLLGLRDDAVDTVIRLREVTAERDEARANYQFMVEKACDEKVPAYREMGQQLADAQAQIERLKRTCEHRASGIARHRIVNSTLTELVREAIALLDVQDRTFRAWMRGEGFSMNDITLMSARSIAFLARRDVKAYTNE